ncbi:MAG TPA: vWA domain-containing protein [Intrasporangium sp.]|uniref:vWA domain-containing protein n=1 Tax=Intrasporangium sp. TaxID=1925024 RepID=UPI002D7961E8|nr:vWA domain-containing protein [Intrasporangium sp.]HET7398551.1 vWA domain-containing protein [Intrasporangium sp.]
MTDPNRTAIYFLLDRSGSMESIRSDTEGGFDAFIAEQRHQPGECRVTLAQFDDEYSEVYRDVLVADVPPLRLQPRGTTALLDSIGRLVTDAGCRLAALPEEQRPGSVILGIMTDGHENASREFTHAQVKAMIETQTRSYGWQFLYLGADQDAIEVGGRLGVGAAHSMTYGRGKVAAMMSATSANIGRYRAARAAGADAAEASAVMAFDDAQRRSAQE